MKHFTSVHDVPNPRQLVGDAISWKKNPYQFETLGARKTLGLIFLNPSLRTRLSTQKAAKMLGMEVMVMNLDKEGWAIEWQDGAVMNGGTTEHIREAARVLSVYCDVIGIRCFPSLTDRDNDYNELVLNQLMRYVSVPVLSLE